MPDLSIVIPGRCEQFFAQTVKNVLENMRGDSEIIAVIDGPWPDPPLQDHPRLKVIHHTVPVGQRAATNDGVKLSRARWVMKLDAHCAVDEGFDVKLMADCQPDWTLIPSMHNLHAFDWVCDCGHRTYQGARPVACEKCKVGNHRQEIVWKPRENRLTVSWMFDKNLQFQYWRKHAKRVKGDLIETMSFIGACMFMERERFWELGGMDEAHGSWGAFGTEWACKSWLSGGKLITSRKTWFAHMFRTGNFATGGQSTWPYPISQSEIDKARAYSRDLWLNDKWPQAKYPLRWLVEKFSPVPTWEDYVWPQREVAA
jgi:glycosyltransferase involved in cell wall biosynthesis